MSGVAFRSPLNPIHSNLFETNRNCNRYQLKFCFYIKMSPNNLTCQLRDHFLSSADDLESHITECHANIIRKPIKIEPTAAEEVPSRPDIEVIYSHPEQSNGPPSLFLQRNFTLKEVRI